MKSDALQQIKLRLKYGDMSKISDTTGFSLEHVSNIIRGTKKINSNNINIIKEAIFMASDSIRYRYIKNIINLLLIEKRITKEQKNELIKIFGS